MESWRKFVLVLAVNSITMFEENWAAPPSQPELDSNASNVTTTQPTTTISVKAEIGPRTNFSSSLKQLYPTTTELTAITQNPSTSSFNAETFFNSSDLVDHGQLNMTKVHDKLTNGSSNVSPLNASSATFKLFPNETTYRSAGKSPHQVAGPLTSSLNNNNTDTIHSMANQLDQMGLKNLTVIPGEPSTHTFNATENIHINSTVTAAAASITSHINSSTTEQTLPENPNDPLQSKYGVVIHASVFFTNGGTTPREPYPKDRYNASFWNDELNQLTNIGKYQSYQLGKWLATRYNDLLNNDQYDSRTVRIDSGQLDSVFMSAESLLAGLFPPRGRNIWKPTLPWQPIPIHSESPSQDSTVSMSKSCRQYDLNIGAANNMQEWTQQFKNYEASFYFIGNNTGLSFVEDNMYDNLLQAYNCYNDLTIEDQFNLSLPEWTKKVYPEPLKSLAEKYLQFCTYTDPMKKFKAGPVLKLLVTDIQNKAINHSAQRLHLYSGNAYGLSAIMNTLGIFNSLIPPPASALLFELREKNDHYTMTVSYKNSTTSTPYLLQIPNCEVSCEYTKFISIASYYILPNWNDECNIITFGDLAYSTPLLVAGLVVILVLIFLCLLLLIKCCKCMSKRKGRITYT